MLAWLAASSTVTQALVATMGTYLLTAVGTLPVLFFRSAPRRLMDALRGFAAGIMVAASCWSLLVPAIARGGVLSATVGLLIGAAFLYIADQCLPHLHGESRRGRGGGTACRVAAIGAAHAGHDSP
jgi:ZIP family zinc transporter